MNALQPPEHAAQSSAILAAVAALPFGLWVYDAANRLVSANAEAWRQLGVGPGLIPAGAGLAEVCRLCAYRGLYGSGDPEAQAAEHVGLDRRKPLRRLLRSADGTCHELFSTPLPDGGFFTVLVDVTAVLSAGDEAIRLARRLEGVLSRLHGGHAVYDSEYRLLLNNPAYADLIGLPRGAVRPGMSYPDVLRLLVERGEFANADAEALVADRTGIDRSRPRVHQRIRPSGEVLRFESQPMPEGGYLVEVTDITVAKLAEDEARRRAAVLDGVLASLPLGVMVIGPDLRIAMLNAAYGRIMAGSPAAVGEHRDTVALRRALAGEYGPGDPEELARQNTTPLGGTPTLRQRTRPDGTVIEVRTAPMPDGGYVQVVADITALHQAQAEASARATILQIMLDNMRHGIVLHDANYRLVMANRLAAKLIGLPPESLRPGRYFHEITEEQAAAGEFGPPEAAAEVLEASFRVDRSRPSRRVRTRPDGTVVEINVDPTPDGGYVSTYSDITALARAEAAAQQRASTLQAMIDSMPHGLALFGPDRRLLTMNALAGRLGGVPEAALKVGRTLDEIIADTAAGNPVGDPVANRELAAAALRADRSRPSRVVRASREGHTLEVRSDPMPDGGFLISHVDITPIARAEAEARSRASTLQVMLDNMRHGICLYDADRRLVTINALALRLWGLRPDQVPLGSTFEHLVDEQRRIGLFGPESEASRVAAEVAGMDRSRSLRYLRDHPGGITLEISSEPTPDGGFVITASDITARARAEAEARDRAAILQVTMNNVRHGIAMYGPDRRLVTANRLAGPSLGLPELEGRAGALFDDLLHDQLAAGTFGSGPEAARRCAGIAGLDRSRSIRYLRRLESGTVVEIASEPTPDGGFVITHTDITDLEQARAEAQRRAATLQGMLDNIRHGIVLFDREHRMVAANALAARFNGMDPDGTHTGFTLAQLLDELVATGRMKPEQAAEQLARDRTQSHRSILPRRDGLVLEVRSDPTPDGGFAVTYSDVTELTQAQSQAQHRAAILQVMLDNIRHGICYFGPDRRVIAANALTTELGNHAPGSVVPGRLIDDLIAEQLGNGAIMPSEHALAEAAQRMDRSKPSRYTRPSGDGRVLEVTSDPTPDGGFVVTQTDITALARAEAEAQRRAAIQQVILDNIRHGTILFDGERRIVAANMVVRQLLELSEEALAPGTHLRELVARLVARGEYDAETAASVLVRDRSIPTRRQRVRTNGTVLETVSDPTPDGGFIMTYTDVTEERRIRAELERAKDAAEAANRTKSRFLATMSHELRTPLNAVIGFSEAILANPDKSRTAEYVGTIHEAGRHLLSLIDDILEVTRAETTGVSVSLGEVDLGGLAAGAVRVIQAQAAEAQVTVQAELPPVLPRLRADELRLRQVLLNLLSNAVKFTPAGGTVTLTAVQEPDGGLELRVSDTGIGISAEDIPRAFEPFTQLDSSLSRRYPGSGLGLYLSRALAEAQGAQLNLESPGGSGTSAVLRFPKDHVLAPLAV